MMLQCVQRLPRVPLPGVQVRGHRPLAQARTGPGVGPVGGALFNENDDFPLFYKVGRQIQRICSILDHLHGVRHILHQKSSKTQGKQTNWLRPEVATNPFKKQWEINIFIEKCAADGSHSRPSPGLGQGPGSSDLHFLGLNLKVVGKQYPA